MELIALRTFADDDGTVLTPGETFTTNDSRGHELINKGWAAGPATDSALAAAPASPPDVSLGDVPEATPDQPQSPTPSPPGATSAGKRSRKPRK